MLLGVFIGHAVAANATQQIADEIIMEDGGLRALFAEPLAAAPDYADVRARLNAYIDPGRCTASARGYVAQWMIFRDDMQLARIVANPCSRRNAVPLDALWPDRAMPVRATWFSGELVARKRGHYLKPGEDADEFVVLTIEKGRVIKRVHRSGNEVPAHWRFM